METKIKAVRLRMKEELLASHRELLEMIAQQQVRVDELFHQSHLCQASLHRTRIELAAIRADTSENQSKHIYGHVEEDNHPGEAGTGRDETTGILMRNISGTYLTGPNKQEN